MALLIYGGLRLSVITPYKSLIARSAVSIFQIDFWSRFLLVMEALGAASSATAVVGAVADVAKETVKFLRRLKNAPLAVFALIEEVTQLQSVIDVVKGACESDQCPPSIPSLLEQAKARLLDLNSLIDRKLTRGKSSVDTDRLAWVRHEQYAKALMERLRNARNNITAVLSISTLYVPSLTGV